MRTLCVVLLLATAGCAAGIPHAGGEPLAPPAPNRLWQPPRNAQVDDPPRGGTVPLELAAVGADSLTLPDIVDLALRNNPATRESWAQAQAYGDAYGAARAAYLPTVAGSLTAASSAQPGYGSTSLSTGNGVAGARSTLQPAVSLSYTVLDFGTRGGNVASARETAYAMSFNHNATIQSTILGVEQAFYAYVAARAVLEADRLSLREAQASYDAALKKDSVGTATQADVLQARTAVAQAQLALDSTQAQVLTTRTTLAVAFGFPASAPYDVAAHSEGVNVADLTENVDSLISNGLQARPDLQAALANVRAANGGAQAARGALLPSVNLSGLWGYTDANLGPLTGRSYSAAVGVSLPLFDGFASRYELARAQANVRYATAYSEALRQSVASAVVTAYYQLKAAAQQVRTTDDLLASATAALRATRARYDAGLATIVDLLTAQSSLASARAQGARSRWTWAERLAELGYAAGALDERGGVRVPVGTPAPP